MSQHGTELVFRVDMRPDFLSFLTNSYATNLPFAQHALISALGDVNMPSVGYIDYHGENLTLSVGRRQLKWGPATYDLALSDSAPYIDHAWFEYRFRTRQGAWWYNFVAIGTDRAGETWDDLSVSRLGYKSIFAHRAGYESDSVRIGIGELNLVHDIAPNLVDMSPIAAFHNMYEDIYSNVFLTATGEYKLGSLRGYGEFVMDDLVMSWESWAGRPTALGWLYGLEYHILSGDPYRAPRTSERDYALKEATLRKPGGLLLSVEHYRTTTYLYNRENPSGKWMLPDHRLVNSSTIPYIDSGDAFYLGFPYGPDASLDMLALSWESRAIKASVILKYLQKGAYTIKDHYPPSTGGESTWYALQEPVTRNVILGLSGSWALSPAVQIWAHGEVWQGDSPQASMSAGCTFTFASQ